MDEIPLKNRILYFFISLPGSIKYIFKIIFNAITTGELPKKLKDGDLIITKDGEILIFDSCDCPQEL